MRRAGYRLDNGREAVASKSLRLYRLPRILVLHLKRFTYNLNGFAKLHKSVRFDATLQCAPPSCTRVGLGVRVVGM